MKRVCAGVLYASKGAHTIEIVVSMAHTLFSAQTERERERERKRKREGGRERKREGDRERGRENRSRIVRFIFKRMSGALAPFSYLVSGSAITNGRERRSCLGRVFNSKLGCIATTDSKYMVCIRQPLLKLKTWPKAGPVSQSLSMLVSYIPLAGTV